MADVCLNTGSEGVIRQLPAEVIKRIAAGEIIVRPSSAIKELIENSIDAGATRIRINMSANPLDFCEIIDNGCGVCEKDLLIICRRFTTSKTRNSIEGVKSLGFRGEALSSLSQSSHITISSRTESEAQRTVVRYMDCEPLMDEITHEEGPAGFHLRYENLFFNSGTRQTSLVNTTNAEFNACLQLIQKYAINFPNINFVFARSNSNVSHLNANASESSENAPNSQNSTDSTTLDYGFEAGASSSQDCVLEYDHHFFAQTYPLSSGSLDDPLITEYIQAVDENTLTALRIIKQGVEKIYGLNVSRILHEFVFNNFTDAFFNCKALISHPNQASKIDIFIVFINNRLIDLYQLRKLIHARYNEVSNNKYRRFVYLSIFVPFDRIDANIHPSKRKIMMDHQNEILNLIVNSFTEKIKQLVRSTNPATTGLSNSKLVTDYKISKENPVNKFKMRINANQMNISHFITPLFNPNSDGSTQDQGALLNRDDLEQFSLNAQTFSSKFAESNAETTNATTRPTFDSEDPMHRTTEEPTSLSDFSELAFSSTTDDQASSTNLSSLYASVNRHRISTKDQSDSQELQSTDEKLQDVDDKYKDVDRRLGTFEDQHNYIDEKHQDMEETGTELDLTDEEPDPQLNPQSDDDFNTPDSQHDIERFDQNVIEIENKNRINRLCFSKVMSIQRLGVLYSNPDVQRLIDAIICSKDEELTRTVLNSSYVGVLDQSYILVQYDNSLIMLNIFMIARECCYQSIIWRLNNLPNFKLSSPIPLREILTHSSRRKESEQEVEDLIDQERIKILNVLFGFHIKDLVVHRIPNPMNGYFPGVEYLPDFFYDILALKQEPLGEMVVGLSKLIAQYYVQPPFEIVPGTEVESNFENFVSRVLFATCQKFSDLSISKELGNRYFLKLANLNLLYRIFERC